MRRWGRRLLVIGALVAVGWLLRVTVLRPQPIAVTVFEAAAGRVEEIVTNSRSGTVRARQRAHLSPALAGRVADLPVRKGQGAAAGDVLLRLADDEFKAQVALAEAALAVAAAARDEACLTSEQAERERRRLARLARDQVVSDEAMERAASRAAAAVAACAAATARVREAGAAREVALATLDKTVLRAPFTGVVAELRAEVGEWISPSPPGVFLPPVIDLIDSAPTYVSAPIDEVDLGRLALDQPVRVALDPFPDLRPPGRVSRIAPYVEDLRDQSRTFEVEIELDDPDFARRLLPGMTADVEIVLAAKEQALRVPSYALIEGSRVLVVRGGRREQRLTSVAVTTGLRNWEFTEILSGLAAGDMVVVSLDRAEVQAGAVVRVGGRTDK